MSYNNCPYIKFFLFFAAASGDEVYVVPSRLFWPTFLPTSFSIVVAATLVVVAVVALPELAA